MIINGLPYGVGNRCRRPAVCPPSGPIAPGLTEYVQQRNNATYEAQENKAAAVGKTIAATNKTQGRLLVVVQANGVSGLKFDQIKEALLGSGCDNAIFFDGSDSSMLNVRGTFEVRPGSPPGKMPPTPSDWRSTFDALTPTIITKSKCVSQELSY